jgi:uncharacterized membrane protein
MVWGIAGIAGLWGFFGALVDSLLGAAFQARYTSVLSGGYTEKPREGAQANILVGGFACFTNDTVNALSTFIAALGAAGSYGLLFSSLRLT